VDGAARDRGRRARLTSRPGAGAPGNRSVPCSPAHPRAPGATGRRLGPGVRISSVRLGKGCRRRVGARNDGIPPCRQQRTKIVNGDTFSGHFVFVEIPPCFNLVADTPPKCGVAGREGPCLLTRATGRLETDERDIDPVGRRAVPRRPTRRQRGDRVVEGFLDETQLRREEDINLPVGASFESRTKGQVHLVARHPYVSSSAASSRAAFAAAR
jgi:hypothetical protein